MEEDIYYEEVVEVTTDKAEETTEEVVADSTEETTIDTSDKITNEATAEIGENTVPDQTLSDPEKVTEADSIDNETQAEKDATIDDTTTKDTETTTDEAKEATEETTTTDNTTEKQTEKEKLAEATKKADEEKKAAEAKKAEAEKAEAEKAEAQKKAEEEITKQAEAKATAEKQALQDQVINVASTYIETQGKTVDTTRVVELYKKYFGEYDGARASYLFTNYKDTFDENGYLSAESQQTALNFINFVRELCGLKTVTLNDESTCKAQAATDYFAAHPDEFGHGAGGHAYPDVSEGSCGNIAWAGPGRANFPHFILMWFGDNDPENNAVNGHRGHMLDVALKTVGMGMTRASNGKTYAVLYIQDKDLSLPDEPVQFPTVVFPTELIDRFKTGLKKIFFLECSSR